MKLIVLFTWQAVTRSLKTNKLEQEDDEQACLVIVFKNYFMLSKIKIKKEKTYLVSYVILFWKT